MLHWLFPSHLLNLCFWLSNPPFFLLQTLKDVQEFLNLPQMELTSRQIKIHKGQLADHIKNWEDVKVTLNGTAYEHLLRADYWATYRFIFLLNFWGGFEKMALLVLLTKKLIQFAQCLADVVSECLLRLFLPFQSSLIEGGPFLVYTLVWSNWIVNV